MRVTHPIQNKGHSGNPKVGLNNAPPQIKCNFLVCHRRKLYALAVVIGIAIWVFIRRRKTVRLPMSIDNSSALLKIDRAKELLDGLDKEVLAWHDTKPYSYFVKINPEKTRASIVVKVHHEPNIIRWSLVIADIIHNLRCALDHTFWAVMLDESSGVIPKKADRLTFPIWDGPPSADQIRNLDVVGLKLFSAIESVQPYHHPFPTYPLHPLAVIRDIDNANKHRLLFTVMASLAKIDVKATGLRKDYQDLSISELHRGELYDGVEAVVTTFDVPHPDMHYECTFFNSIIAIKHPIANSLGQDRDDYAAFIDTVIDEVRKTIDAFILAAT